MTRAPDTLSSQQGLALIDNAETGLKGLIAIHSTSLGPVAGGGRLWQYTSHAVLAQFALRRAAGMSYKDALAGLPFGGGKTVLMAPVYVNREAVFHALRRAVAKLCGGYLTAEEVGTGVADMEAERPETQIVTELNARPGFTGGDPSPWTALGTFEAIKFVAARRYDSDLAGLTVTVQGLGNVGRALCGLLANAGAKLVVADVEFARVPQMIRVFGATPCAPEHIHQVPADILAPCALGGTLSEQTISKLCANSVRGAANNQVATVEGHQLHERGVLYCPDYVFNAGGIINLKAEHLGKLANDVAARVLRMPQRLETVLDRSDAWNLQTSVVADRMAAEMIAAEPHRHAA